MQEYEIRLLTTTDHLALKMTRSYFSDFAAIRIARSLHRSEETVQVWRGGDCIYQAGCNTRASARLNA